MMLGFPDPKEPPPCPMLGRLRRYVAEMKSAYDDGGDTGLQYETIVPPYHVTTIFYGSFFSILLGKSAIITLPFVPISLFLYSLLFLW